MGVTSMLATLDSSSAFFSDSCGDFATTDPAKSKQAGNRQAMETSPFESKERLLIDTLNSALEMIASGKMTQQRASVWQAPCAVNGPALRSREHDVNFRGVGV
jgi:hypothetical protein